MNSKKIELLVLPSIQNIEEIIKGIPIVLTKANYSSLEFRFKDNAVSILHKGRDIKSFSLVWLSSSWYSRDLATTVKLYLDNYNVPNTFVEQSTSKITDNMNFVLNGIPCPNTYYMKKSKIMRHLEDIEAVCGYPMIMKDSKGHHGKNSAYISTREELIEKISNQKPRKRYIFQKYIANDYDWGVLVANNKVVSAERSYHKDGEFRNNVGATEVFSNICDVPEDIKEIALKGSKILGLSWSRSDIVVDKKTSLPYLLEVNRFPGITTDSSEVTGACEFITKHINQLVS
ncbi:hypothetical protein M0R04_00265 [Candidatus Dojkabacteria bacterium]|jgi:glutathione synthase/RimK-type ligase-like ATP-grasp enzyme|nr:hypothetical protein [Candidatus Dojkabacteria bacterium]